MSRVSRHKEKHGGKSSEVFSEDNYPDEGTAARTRPLSFGEIMSKRESKKLVCDGVKEDIAEEVSRVGNPQNVAERGKEQRSHRSTENVSEMGKKHWSDRSTERNSDMGKEHNSDRSTQKVSERGKEQRSDRSAQKVSEGGKERRRDRSTQKVSERDEEHRSDRSTHKVSERGKEHWGDKSTQKVSESGKEQRSLGSTEKVSKMGKEPRNRINEEVSERGKEQRDDRGAGKVLARGKERNNARNIENVLEMGKEWNNNRNTEHYLGRPKEQNNNRYTEKVSERGTGQSEHRNTEIVSERGDQRIKDGSPEKVLERGGRRVRDLSPVIQKHLSERDTKASSKKTEENVSMKDGPLTKSRFCETHDSEAKLKEKIDRDLKAKGKIEERSYDRRKSDDLTKSRHRDVYSSDIKSKEKKDRDLKAEGKTQEIVHDRRKTDDLAKSNYREILISKTTLKEQKDRDMKAKGNTEEKVLDPRKRDDLNISRDRETHSSQLQLTVKMDRDLKSKGSAEEKAHGSSKDDEEQNKKHKSEGSEKRARNLAERDRDLDGRKGFPKRESKRKHHHGDEGKDRDGRHTRRRELDKGHNAEAIERTERKEPSKSHYEEIRPTGRRPRSRERDGKRWSASPLPRSKKPAVYHGREHEELSVKGISGQEQFEVDRKKSMNKASSDQYKRHSSSKSGLGGYSPRKRRTTAAARTPSPTKNSLETRAKWDLAPKGVENTSSLPVPPVFQLSNQNASSNIYGTVGAFSVPPAIVKPFSGVSSGILPTYMNYSIDSVQLTQATRPMRRLYVENIPAAASEKTVMEWLNNLFISSGVNHILGTQPCISCIIHREKGQALVEFLTPEDASTALSFDGGSLYDSTIKIRRPKDFVEMKTGKLEKSVVVADAVSNIVKDLPGKIFIGGISKALSSEMVMAIAGSFGPLETYHFDNSDLNGPYAFVEYADQSVASKARAGLNGMKLGGQIISVVEIAPDASNSESIGKPPYGIPEQAKPLLNEPKQVLKLKNVFDQDTLQSISRTEIEEALEDVRRECMRFGTVKSVNVVEHSLPPIIVTEACVINEKMDCMQSREDFRHYETNTETEVIEEAAHPKPVKDDCIECDKPAENLMDPKSFKPGETDGIMAVGDPSGNITTSEEHHQRTTKDEPDCTHDKVIDNFEMKDTNMEDKVSMHGSEELDQQSSKDEMHFIRDEVIDSAKLKGTSMEEEFPIKEELNLEEVDGKAVKSVADDCVTEVNGIEKGDKREQNENLGRIFEPGCVFVEFGRTEASCAAAHCLHGRLFDNRTVAVEYVPLEIYLTKFPK